MLPCKSREAGSASKQTVDGCACQRGSPAGMQMRRRAKTIPFHCFFLPPPIRCPPLRDLARLLCAHQVTRAVQGGKYGAKTGGGRAPKLNQQSMRAAGERRFGVWGWRGGGIFLLVMYRWVVGGRGAGTRQVPRVPRLLRAARPPWRRPRPAPAARLQGRWAGRGRPAQRGQALGRARQSGWGAVGKLLRSRSRTSAASPARPRQCTRPARCNPGRTPLPGARA